MNLRALILLTVLGLPFPALAQPTVEICGTPGLPFGSNPSLIQDFLQVNDDFVVADTQVGVDVTHAFIGDIVMNVTSPFGTVVRLHDEGGLNGPAILANFTDQGVPNGSVLYNCDCDLQPSGPGVMADFSGVTGAGEWTLTLEDVFPSSEDGVLNGWCVRLFDAAPPVPVDNLVCTTVAGTLVADLSWSLPVAYDALNIYVEGTLIDTLAGDTAAYSAPPQALPGFVEMCVEGVVGGAVSSLRCCSIFLDGTPDVEVCSAPDAPISGGLPATIDVIDVATTADIVLLEVRLEITHAFVGDLEVDVQSPAATSVRLHDQGGFADQAILITYNDFGLVNGIPYGCDCFKQPSGPGSLADFDGENTLGPWTLTAADVAAADDGTLDLWCVRAYTGGGAGPQFIRGDANGDGMFNGLVDGLTALNFQFIPGSLVPPCMEAADADNNGAFNGLVDGLYLLSAQFIPGSPLPPAPFPNCGLDDDNALGCDAPPCP